MASGNGLLSVGKQVGDPFNEAVKQRSQNPPASADPLSDSEIIAKGRAASSAELRAKAEAKAKELDDAEKNPTPTASPSPKP